MTYHKLMIKLHELVSSGVEPAAAWMQIVPNGGEEAALKMKEWIEKSCALVMSVKGYYFVPRGVGVATTNVEAWRKIYRFFFVPKPVYQYQGGCYAG